MGDSGVDHLQELVLSFRVLVHNIFGLVDHLDQAILLSHHFILLAFYLDVRIWLWDLFLVFFMTVLLRFTLFFKTDYDFLENNIIQYCLIDEANVA